MAKKRILDSNESKPRRANTTYTWVWEVIKTDYDDYGNEDNEIEAVFYDPWKALQYATLKFGICATVQASRYKTDTL